MLLVVVLFSFGIRFSDAVVCLSCSSEPKASDCMTVEKCGSHSACSVEMFVSAAGFIRYDVGCKDKQFCHSSRRRSKGIQNITSLLEREERATTVCRECCDNDLCNAAGCTSPGYATPRGPVCYACAQQQSQGACNQIQLCGRDEYCCMERHQYGTDYLYTSACMSKLTCNALGITGMAHTVHVATIIGRNVNEPLDETINVRQHEKFSDKDKRTANVNPRLCCTTDLCNNGSMLIAVNGGWSAWSSWSGCSVTCNTGVRTRTRSCTNPAPRNGGSVCTGNSQESHTCKITDCPIDGSWSSWSIWSSCSATCGAAISSRTRSCSNPASRYGGKHCVGLSHGSVPCHLQHCPVDGEWSGWSTWGSCSASCGVATKSRSRTCSNPAPRYGGKSCLGNSQDQTSCNLHSCKVDGQWSSWNSWTACTASCGTAPKSRSRLCNNPAPANGGKACTGGSTETTSCNLQACPGTVLANPSTMPTYTCLSCSASASPRDCNFVQQCGPNSVCYLEKHLTTGAYYSFYSGCRDRQFCHSKIGRRRDLYTNTSVFGDDLNNDKKYPRNAINNDKIVCSECCEGDLCNSKGCSEPGYPPKQGPICYKCDQQSSPHQCNEITICNTDEACHLTYTQFIGVVYSTGCHKKADCMAKGYYNTGPVATMIGRRAANLLKPSYHANNTSAVRSNLDRRWITPCSKCCSGNLCNRDTCQNIIQHTTTNAIFTATPATTKPSSNPQLTTVHNALSTKGHHQQTSHKTSPVKVTPTTNMHYVTSYITHSQHVSQPVTTNKHHRTTKAHHHVTTAKSPVTVPVTQMSTTHRHNAGGGHIVSVCPVWAAWTQWSSCNEARVQLTGYAERRRTCNDGNFELDKKYCGQYITPHCVPPTITQVDVTIGAWTAGGSVNLECTVAGSPTPTITWKCFNNCEALPDLFEYGQSIFASNLDSRYSGTYQCVADNQCGHATKNYVATVT